MGTVGFLKLLMTAQVMKGNERLYFCPSNLLEKQVLGLLHSFIHVSILHQTISPFMYLLIPLSIPSFICPSLLSSLCLIPSISPIPPYVHIFPLSFLYSFFLIPFLFPSNLPSCPPSLLSFFYPSHPSLHLYFPSIFPSFFLPHSISITL